LKTAETAGSEIDKVWKEVFAKRHLLVRENAETNAFIESLTNDFNQNFNEAITAAAFDQVDADIQALKAKITQQETELTAAKALLDEKKQAVDEAENKFKEEQAYWVQRAASVKDVREKIVKWKTDAGAALDANDGVKAYDLIKKLGEGTGQLNQWSDPTEERVTNLPESLNTLLTNLENALKAYLAQADVVDQKLQVLDVDSKALESKQSARYNKIREIIDQKTAEADNPKPPENTPGATPPAGGEAGKAQEMSQGEPA
jgi:predicted  nucleic acid-binding Zn-ribbon protein